MVLLEFSMSPMGVGESVSTQVARILDVVDRSGVTYQLTPMGTILEGDWAEVMGVVSACFEALAADCPRIGVHLKVDYRACISHWTFRSKLAERPSWSTQCRCLKQLSVE